MSFTALITGATGLVGSELLNMLIDSEDYNRIIVLNRRNMNYSSSKVIEHVIDFDNLASFEPDLTVDHIFCCLGTTIKKAKTKEIFRKVDYDYVIGLAKRSTAYQASKFLVISALGANAGSAIFYNRVKGEMEKDLQNLDLPHLFIFRPSLLMGDRKENRIGEKTAMMVYKVINPLFTGRLKKYKGIPVAKVARGMLETALHNNETFKIFESDELQNF